MRRSTIENKILLTIDINVNNYENFIIVHNILNK
jgi:hypothetical protein